jgi:pSer/pThr/pTyr-binding forkhead associated (FHA) protein
VLAAGRTSLVAGDSLALGPVTSLGRSEQSTIVLDDTFVSSEHAVISFRGGRWWLTDLGSTNGTTLNERPVQGEVGLTGGDIVAVGDVELKVML